VTSVVLDASALLALVLDEPGGPRVRTELPDSALSVVNLAEVVGYYARMGSDPESLRRELREFEVQVYDLDENLAYAIGLLRPLTEAAGLSLADRACLALARRLGVPALTSDRQWATVADAVGVEVRLIR
jgi:ribonuclease VapC